MLSYYGVIGWIVGSGRVRNDVDPSQKKRDGSACVEESCHSGVKASPISRGCVLDTGLLMRGREIRCG